MHMKIISNCNTLYKTKMLLAGLYSESQRHYLGLRIVTAPSFIDLRYDPQFLRTPSIHVSLTPLACISQKSLTLCSRSLILIPWKPDRPEKDKNLAYVNAYTQLYNSAHTKDFQNVFQNSNTGSQVAKLTQALSISSSLIVNWPHSRTVFYQWPSYWHRLYGILHLLQILLLGFAWHVHCMLVIVNYQDYYEVGRGFWV